MANLFPNSHRDVLTRSKVLTKEWKAKYRRDIRERKTRGEH